MKVVKDETKENIVERKYRARMIRVAPQLLVNLFVTGEIHAEVKGIPKGCIYRGWAHDHGNNNLNLFIEHESFDEIELGDLCPVQDVTIFNIKPEINQAKQGE